MTCGLTLLPLLLGKTTARPDLVEAIGEMQRELDHLRSEKKLWEQWRLGGQASPQRLGDQPSPSPLEPARSCIAPAGLDNFARGCGRPSPQPRKTFAPAGWMKVTLHVVNCKEDVDWLPPCDFLSGLRIRVVHKCGMQKLTTRPEHALCMEHVQSDRPTVGRESEGFLGELAKIDASSPTDLHVFMQADPGEFKLSPWRSHIRNPLSFKDALRKLASRADLGFVSLSSELGIVHDVCAGAGRANGKHVLALGRKTGAIRLNCARDYVFPKRGCFAVSARRIHATPQEQWAAYYRTFAEHHAPVVLRGRTYEGVDGLERVWPLLFGCYNSTAAGPHPAHGTLECYDAE